MGWVLDWPAMERLQIQAPLDTGFFSPMNILNSTLINEKAFSTKSTFRGDVKPLFLGVG